MSDIPMSPEAWRDVVQQAVDETGHGDEVVIGTEVTMAGWRVTITPPIVPVDPPVVIE